MSDKYELRLNYWLVKAHGAQEHMERQSLNNKALSTALGRTSALWDMQRSQQQMHVCALWPRPPPSPPPDPLELGA